MWHKTMLLCFVLLVLPQQGVAFQEKENKGGFNLRSHKSMESRLAEAFLQIRQEHARRVKLGISTTRTATQAPPHDAFLQALEQEDLDHKSTHPPLNGAQLKNVLKENEKRVDASNNTDGVLFAVFTAARNYDTRLASILQTWGKDIPRERFMAVTSDKKRTKAPFEEGDLDPHEPGTDVVETQCPHQDVTNDEGACCKWAEAVILAQKRMKQDPSLKWAFFSDDDVFLRPGPLAETFRVLDEREENLRHNYKDAPAPLSLGLLGCSTPTGCGGLCGGGGFALNRIAVDKLIDKDPVSFLQQNMNLCDKCQGWADQAMGEMWKQKGLHPTQFYGSNGWQMTKRQFDQQLAPGGSRLVYHYVRYHNQFEAMQDLFTNRSQVSQAQCYGHCAGACMGFQGHETCTLSEEAGDVPWMLS